MLNLYFVSIHIGYFPVIRHWLWCSICGINIFVYKDFIDSIFPYYLLIKGT